MKEHCWLSYLEKYKLCIQDLEYVLIVADMLQNFYKILSEEKEKFLDEFQQAIRLRFIEISSR